MGRVYVFRRGGGSTQETTMGLLDVLNGMQHGPRGPSTPSSQSEGGGMSPMTMAILALLAWKAVKHFGGSQPGAAPATPKSAPPLAPNTVNAGLPGGGLSDVLKGGLGDLLNQLQKGGQGEVANSWVGKGENKPIAPGDLANALGADQIDAIASQAGLPRDELLKGLSQYLPNVIDHLTPDGRLPNERELSGRI